MKYNVCSKHMMTHMYVTFVRGSIGFPSEKNTDRLVFPYSEPLWTQGEQA